MKIENPRADDQDDARKNEALNGLIDVETGVGRCNRWCGYDQIRPTDRRGFRARRNVDLTAPTDHELLHLYGLYLSAVGRVRGFRERDLNDVVYPYGERNAASQERGETDRKRVCLDWITFHGSCVENQLRNRSTHSGCTGSVVGHLDNFPRRSSAAERRGGIRRVLGAR